MRVDAQMETTNGDLHANCRAARPRNEPPQMRGAMFSVLQQVWTSKQHLSAPPNLASGLWQGAPPSAFRA